mgnify:CR=1 FL=1
MFSKESVLFLIIIWSLFLIWEFNLNCGTVQKAAPLMRYDLVILPALILTTGYVFHRHFRNQK